MEEILEILLKLGLVVIFSGLLGLEREIIYRKIVDVKALTKILDASRNLPRFGWESR